MFELRFKCYKTNKFILRFIETFEQAQDYIRDFYFPELEDSEIGEWDYSELYYYMNNKNINNMNYSIYLFNNTDEYGKTFGMGGKVVVGIDRIQITTQLYAMDFITEDEITCIIRKI